MRAPGLSAMAPREAGRKEGKGVGACVSGPIGQPGAGRAPPRLSGGQVAPLPPRLSFRAARLRRREIQTAQARLARVRVAAVTSARARGPACLADSSRLPRGVGGGVHFRGGKCDFVQPSFGEFSLQIGEGILTGMDLL